MITIHIDLAPRELLAGEIVVVERSTRPRGRFNAVAGRWLSAESGFWPAQPIFGSFLERFQERSSA